MEDRSVLLQIDSRGAATITLNRPDVHNCFDEAMVAGLRRAVHDIAEHDDVRVASLVSRGPTFSAGADLNWMREVADQSEADNQEDARQLGSMLNGLAHLAVPTVALVQGNAYGGGIGLIAACDMVVAVKDCVFAFTEVNLGLIPAVISPFVVAAIGARQARRYFITGEKFDTYHAQGMGLIHEMVPTQGALVAQGEYIVDQILQSEPGAVSQAKALIADVGNRPIDVALIDDVAHRIAARRATDEGKEGVSAFLERRKPNWID